MVMAGSIFAGHDESEQDISVYVYSLEKTRSACGPTAAATALATASPSGCTRIDIPRSTNLRTQRRCTCRPVLRCGMGPYHEVKTHDSFRCCT
jgi:hypothetical protein